MTIEECYEQLGGNFEVVKSRLPSVKLIERFTGKFLDDKSFEELCSMMECENRQEAFRASHTLKGICANLSFDRLLTSASLLTEELRKESGTISDEAKKLFLDVKKDYAITTDAIRRYLDI